MPQFVSEGAKAANAIEQFFMQRELMNRQAMLDEFARKRDEEAARERERNRLTAENEAKRRQAIEDEDRRITAEDRARTIARQTQQDDVAAGERRQRQNQVGVRQMMTDRLTQGPLDRATAEQLSVMGWSEGVGVPGVIDRAAEPPNRTVVQTTDERGRPVRRAVTDEELATGVPEYRAPERPDYEWVVRDGQPLQIRKGTARPGDQPFDSVAARGGGGGSDYGRFLARWANDRGLDVNRLSSAQELEARRLYSDAGRDSLFGLDDEDVSAAPTPTGRGAGAAAGGGRTATAAEVQSVAQRAGISEAEARRRLEAAGVVIR